MSIEKLFRDAGRSLNNYFVAFEDAKRKAMKQAVEWRAEYFALMEAALEENCRNDPQLAAISEPFLRRAFGDTQAMWEMGDYESFDEAEKKRKRIWADMARDVEKAAKAAGTK